MLGKLDTLNKLFDGQISGVPIMCNRTYSDCDKAVAIKIDQKAGGYGLQGAALHKIGNWQFVVRCDTCHQVSSTPEDVDKSPETSVDDSLVDVCIFSKLGRPKNILTGKKEVHSSISARGKKWKRLSPQKETVKHKR